MQSYQKRNNSLGWIFFLLSGLLYTLTVEPSASFWDCGEFIAASWKLQVGHPPGAPLYLMLGRFFSLFAGNDTSKVALAVNMLSVIASALTVMFLFWTITHFLRRIVSRHEVPTTHQQWLVFLGGGIGALTFAASDSFWFSAVEAEVYALSSLFTAVVFWAALKWEESADTPHATRWLILIAYLMGLSIGVHLLNLLAIPAIVFIVYYRLYKPSVLRGLMMMGLGMLLLVFVMYGIIQGLVRVATYAELLFVNGLSLPFNSGLLFFVGLLFLLLFTALLLSRSPKFRWPAAGASIAGLSLSGIPFIASNPFIIALIIISLAFGVIWLARHRLALLNTILLGCTMLVMGYSSYSMIVIRSLANPSMDENNPEEAFALLSYLNREQYGDRPLFYGKYYSAPAIESVPDGDVLAPVGRRYEVVSTKNRYIYPPELMTIFPRMYSGNEMHCRSYRSWAGVNPNRTVVADMPSGPREIEKPTFLNNIAFFLTYQTGQMYFRYLLWNFAGRQNDLQGHGGRLKGNWLSGIPILDAVHLGTQRNLPPSLADNPARNAYFLLPLLLGILGMFYTQARDPRQFNVILLLFIFTGIAIVLYLNQTPNQPRERDYAFAGSYYTFAIWIGLGVAAITEFLQKHLKWRPALIVATILNGFIPAWVLAVNYNDHNRSGRETVAETARNTLNSCDKNAILFTFGDNDTFPLWYVQEVEGIRTDVRTVNTSLLNTDWYIDQMLRRVYLSAPLPISLSHEQYAEGARDAIFLDTAATYMDLKEAVKFASNDQLSAYGNGYNYLPTNKFSMKVDKAALLADKSIPFAANDSICEEIRWEINRRYITKSDLIILDMIANANWQRPVYFASSGGGSDYLGLDKYLRLEGLAYRLVPVEKKDTLSYIGFADCNILYSRLMEQLSWKAFKNKHILFDEQNRRNLRIVDAREVFLRLAQSCLETGRKDSALHVLNFATQLFPDKVLPYDQASIHMIDLYYQCGADEQGDKLAHAVLNKIKKENRYYETLRKKANDAAEPDYQINLGILEKIKNVAQSHHRINVLNKL